MTGHNKESGWRIHTEPDNREQYWTGYTYNYRGDHTHSTAMKVVSQKANTHDLRVPERVKERFYRNAVFENHGTPLTCAGHHGGGTTLAV